MKTRNDLQWDKDGFYRYKSTGRRVSDAQLIRLIRREQNDYIKSIDYLTNRLLSGNLNYQDYQNQVAMEIKDAHVSMMRLGRGGRDATYGIHYLDVANQLRTAEYPALRQLFQDLSDGKLSPAQLRARLVNYVRSSKISYEQGRKTRLAEISPKRYARRFLGAMDARNCPDCLRYAQMGVQLSDSLPLPGQDCVCRGNCRCSIRYARFPEELG
jgi:hypothetical protein